jgi:methylated-DNA-[protein]-cysteine S-methyltransferase
MIDSVQALTDVPEEALTRLHRRLEADAADHDLLDIAYRTVETPVGELLLAATTRGLVRIAYASEGWDAVLQSLAAKISPRILQAPRRLDAAATQLDDYFAGHRKSFQLPLDLRLSTGFRRSVLEHLRGIGYGSTESYGAVAAATGHATAVRAVGSACATNPLPVVVPCHRVLRTGGGLGGYTGGVDRKERLLHIEGVVL